MDLPIDASRTAKLKELRALLEAERKKLTALRQRAKSEQANWEKQALARLKESPNWSLLTVEQFTATGGPSHKVLKDGSVLVSGNNPDSSTYTITTDSRRSPILP